MANGAPVYNDPYEKTDLKGQAMLLNRVADTEAQTHHTITCQRWWVQFDEDQVPVAHWVDPNDFYVWSLPFIGTGAITFSRNDFTFNLATEFQHVKYGESANVDIGGTRVGCYLAPFPGRLRRVSFHSHCSNVVGAPGQLTLHIVKSDADIQVIDVAGYDNPAIINYQLSDDWDDELFAVDDRLTCYLKCTCAEGESLSHNVFTCSFHVQWGPYS